MAQFKWDEIIICLFVSSLFITIHIFSEIRYSGGPLDCGCDSNITARCQHVCFVIVCYHADTRLSEQLQEAASIAIDSDASLRLYSTFDQFRSYFDGFPIDLLETQMYSQA